MAQVAVDNDILIKGAWYALLRQLVAVVPSTPGETLILGQAQYVVRDAIKRMAKRKGIPGAAEAQAVFDELLPDLVSAEPTEEEALLAASFERAAQQAGLAVDTGESLLCAIALTRSLTRVATGDKRALRGLEVLVDTHPDLKKLEGSFVCLEQLLVRLLANGDPSQVRAAICARANVDISLAMCFSCTNPSPPEPGHWKEGLASYINGVRTEAPTLLEP
jgi:hypothetical protein